MDRYYGDDDLPTFKQIVELPDTDISTREIFSTIKDEHKPLELIGVIKDGDIYIVEGMHRCVAIALAVSKGKKIEADVRISLSNIGIDFELIGPTEPEHSEISTSAPSPEPAVRDRHGLNRSSGL